MINQEANKNILGRCLNCEEPLPESAIFCSNCGQSKKESKLSVWNIIGDAFQNLFNLDGRFFNTLRHLHQPSKLTKAFVEGKRKTYMNPGRLFIFSLIALISVLLLDIKLDDVSLISENLHTEVELAKQKIVFDSLVADMDKESDSNFQALRDSLYGDIDLDKLYLGDSGSLTIMGFDISDYKIKKSDAIDLDPDELVDKYNIEGFGKRLYIKQYVKAINNPSGGINYIVKNLTWVLLIVIFVMAIVMQLFYIRNNYYYIEHLILLMYNHSLLFLVFSIFLLISHFVGGSKLLRNILFIGIPVVQFISLKKYYRQSIFMTLLKMLMINFSYLIIAVVITALGAVIAFFIF